MGYLSRDGEDVEKSRGVATYKTVQDMPQKLPDALLPTEGLRAHLEESGD